MSKGRSFAWIAWMVVSLFYAYQYVLRVIPNILLEDLIGQFHVSASAFGQFSGVYYLGYSLMHLPVGLMLDRYGPRKVMTVCILLSSVGLLPLILAKSWIYPVLGRLLVGMGSSAAILGVFKMVRMAFHEKKFSRMLSFSVMIGLLGAIYGGGPVNYLKEAVGYHAVIKMLAGLGAILAFVTYWLVPSMKQPHQGTVLSDIKEVFGNRKVLSCCLFAGLMVGPMEGFADVWGAAFLKKVYGMDGSIAASLPSLIFIGMCFGSPLLSLIAEKRNNYLATITGAGLLMAVSFFALLLFPFQAEVLSAAFLWIGVCCAYQILAIYLVSTYVREEVAGLTTAIANMIIMIFGYVFHATIGGIVNALGGVNAPQALSKGVLVIPVALCLGTAGFFLLSQKKKKRAKVPRDA